MRRNTVIKFSAVLKQNIDEGCCILFTVERQFLNFFFSGLLLSKNVVKTFVPVLVQYSINLFNNEIIHCYHPLWPLLYVVLWKLLLYALIYIMSKIVLISNSKSQSYAQWPLDNYKIIVRNYVKIILPSSTK